MDKLANARPRGHRPECPAKVALVVTALLAGAHRRVISVRLVRARTRLMLHALCSRAERARYSCSPTAEYRAQANARPARARVPRASFRRDTQRGVARAPGLAWRFGAEAPS